MGQKRNTNVAEEFVTTNFSLQVATHVIQEKLSNNESVVCSPVSIDAILSILALGVENSTLDQLLTLLGHSDLSELNTAASKLRAVLKVTDDEDAPKISFVNGLWLNQRFSLKPAFQEVLKDVHNAEARAVDFVNQADQVVNEVNSWAEKETKGLIKQVLSRSNINSDTLLFLGNALYFKGNWLNYFELEDTEDDDFNLLNGKKIRVPMMNQSYQRFEYHTSDSCQVLKMPYEIGAYSEDEDEENDADDEDEANDANDEDTENDGKDEDEAKEFSMYVFLPREKNGLPNLMNEIKIDADLFNKLKLVKITHLSIPKFKFECDLALKEPMKQLGLSLPFEKTCKDFSGMTDVTEPIYVSDISQKCFVETNERGTVAAAVTEMGIYCGAAPPPKRPPPPINFVADHPFMFVIREDVSGAILFVGTVLDPR
ncbi:serpin-Z2B-like [Silene latifolia]|uniref:serpin-Z2B-like n=1 Tax=Silene latifolia TaxID=37657 RepID=UPI003D77BF24